MAEVVELARLEVTAIKCGDGVNYNVSTDGEGEHILMGLVFLLRSIAKKIDVSGDDFLAVVKAGLATLDNPGEGENITQIDIGALKRAMEGRGEG